MVVVVVSVVVVVVTVVILSLGEPAGVRDMMNGGG